MPKLNLETKNKAQELIKAYLEENASELLAEKINNGVRIQKDGKTLISKKTLNGFMTFAADEAKKQAEKGARSACVGQSVVFGWAVHYFEEDSIEGTLYNEDGTEYKPPKPVAKTKPATSSPAPTAQKPKPQMSLFDMLDAPSGKQTTPSETEESDEQDTPSSPAPVDDGKHWVDDTTYIDEDGVVHNLDEKTDDEPEFDISAFDTEALAILDEMFGNEITLR